MDDLPETRSGYLWQSDLPSMWRVRHRAFRRRHSEDEEVSWESLWSDLFLGNFAGIERHHRQLRTIGNAEMWAFYMALVPLSGLACIYIDNVGFVQALRCQLSEQ